MKKILTILIILSLSKNIIAQNGYFLTFGCCYKKAKIIVRDIENGEVMKLKITTSSSTGIVNQSYFLDSSFSNTTLKFEFRKKKQSFTLKIEKSNQLKFIYVWYYDDKFYGEILDNWRYAQ